MACMWLVGLCHAGNQASSCSTLEDVHMLSALKALAPLLGSGAACSAMRTRRCCRTCCSAVIRITMPSQPPSLLSQMSRGSLKAHGKMQAAFDLMAEVMAIDSAAHDEGIKLLTALHFDSSRPSNLSLGTFAALAPNITRYMPSLIESNPDCDSAVVLQHMQADCLVAVVSMSSHSRRDPAMHPISNAPDQQLPAVLAAIRQAGIEVSGVERTAECWMRAPSL